MEMNSCGLVSTVIPSYNSAKFIIEAIESVLSQTYKNIEIIVSDDGSDDNTEEVLRPYLSQIVYLKGENSGPATARNRALKIVRGEFIAFLDADDIWLPKKLEEQMKMFIDNPECSVLYSRHMDFDHESGKKLSIFPDKIYSGMVFDVLLVEKFISLPTIVFKKSIMDEIGFFNENLQTAEDTNFFLRIARKYQFCGMENIHVHRRKHQNNISDRFDIRVGTLDNLDDIVRMYPECHPDKYVPMKNAYRTRGTDVVIDSFYFGNYILCHKMCIKLLKMKIVNKTLFSFWLITFLHPYWINKLKEVLKQKKLKDSMALKKYKADLHVFADQELEGNYSGVKKFFRLLITQGVWAISVYRYGQWVYSLPNVISILFRVTYIFLSKMIEVTTGIMLPCSVKAEGGLYIGHFGGIIINGNVVLGKNCKISHGVTIGTCGNGKQGVPVIGDNVYIGAGAKILGPIIIGDNVVVGANAVVVKNVPSDTKVVGVPARAINKINQV